MGLDVRMAAATPDRISPATVRGWADRLVSAFGTEAFCIWHPGDDCDPQDALEIDTDEDRREYFGVGTGGTVITCNLAGRYYGAEYARGDLPLYLSVAQWLEDVIPHATIWYGGDCAPAPTVFDAAARDALQRHYVTFGHRSASHGADL